MPPTIPVTIKLKPRIVLPTAAIRQLTQIGQKNQREALTLSPHEWSAICKECAIVPQLGSLLAPIRSHASAWQSEIVRRSNFSISGPTVEFQPESSYATHPHFFKLSMVCALLLNADAFNGATHHFSSILVDYYSNFRASCFSRFHQDSYWKSCILDVSGNQDGRTELLFVHGNIGIPFMQRQSQGLIVFPQKKPTSIDALGISLDQINTLWVIDTDTPTKQTKTSHPIAFHRHL